MEHNWVLIYWRSRSFTSHEQSDSVTFPYIFVRYCVRKLGDFGTIAFLTDLPDFSMLRNVRILIVSCIIIILIGSPSLLSNNPKVAAQGATSS